MPGPQPKNPSQRRRRNTVSTTTTLVAVDPTEIQIPKLPELSPKEIKNYKTGEVTYVPREWHKAAISWWNDIWSSPMSPEWDLSDIHGLYLLAELINTFWMLPPDKVKARSDLAAEIRLQRQSYGLSPMDRRRLQWTIEKADEATDTGNRRRSGQASIAGGSNDPRLQYGDVIDAEEVDE